MRLVLVSIFNAIESWLFSGIKTEADQMEKGISTVRSKFYFLVRATRYYKRGAITITRAVEIAIDPSKQTKTDAEYYASREFIDLDDKWTICVAPLSHYNFVFHKEQIEEERELIRHWQTSEPTTKTNS